MYNTIIANIDELWLKGKNRPLYFRVLREHIKEVVKIRHSDRTNLSLENHRFILRSESEFGEDTIIALSKIPGLHSLIPAIRIEKSFENIFPSILKEIGHRGIDNFSNFKIETKRADKLFPLSSMEVSRMIGALVQKKFPDLKAKMKNPDLRLEIRILSDFIYISSRRIDGIGGLPSGTNGHLITLLSGGIDSPVASFLMSKRGCRQTFLFFYAYPMVGDEVKKKIDKLISILSGYQKFTKLYIIKFGDFQKKLAKLCKEEYRTILFRVYMMKCGSMLARNIGADALLTGDSLGQVSSQTLTNISVIDRFTDISILRPLIGQNKIEIIELAKKIGTYDTSIIPYDDACSMLAPKHPVIRADINYVNSFLEENQLTEELELLMNEADIYFLNSKGEIKKK
ncbi:MAG: tRNA uracil 4-sulfurtransferase ThiI [Acidobacteriota bacterium]